MLKLLASTEVCAALQLDGLRRREEGQTMAEYGVVLAVITLPLITAIALFSDNVVAVIEGVVALLPG